MNKTLVVAFVLLVLAGFLFWGFQTGFFSAIFSGPANSTPNPEGVILFYGADCPHCKIVEAFISDNKISEKVSFANLEIPFNGKTSSQLATNANLLIETAKKCNIDISGGVSIPFLYDGAGKCFTGDVDVINFFKNAANIK